MFLKRELVGENARGLVDFLNENYNYCYLDSMHHLNKIIKPKNIVTGISYTLDAINPQIFTEPTINFAMHSQDLYYDYLHAKRAIEANAEIENCIISLGYYSLFYDMSRASTSAIISDVQYPLFHDTHNMTLDESVTEDYSSEKYIRERTFAREYFGRYPAYYGPAISLNLMAPDIGKLGGWSNLSPEKRDELARDVAGKHNRHIAHTATFEENVKILNDYIEMLTKHSVRPYIVVMPFTPEYLRYINPEYKERQFKVLEELPYYIDYLDMNDLDIFEENDFLDQAHLNEEGAIKATQIINQLISGM